MLGRKYAYHNLLYKHREREREWGQTLKNTKNLISKQKKEKIKEKLQYVHYTNETSRKIHWPTNNDSYDPVSACMHEYTSNQRDCNQFMHKKNTLLSVFALKPLGTGRWQLSEADSTSISDIATEESGMESWASILQMEFTNHKHYKYSHSQHNSQNDWVSLLSLPWKSYNLEYSLKICKY